MVESSNMRDKEQNRAMEDNDGNMERLQQEREEWKSKWRQLNEKMVTEKQRNKDYEDVLKRELERRQGQYENQSVQMDNERQRIRELEERLSERNSSLLLELYKMRDKEQSTIEAMEVIDDNVARIQREIVDWKCKWGQLNEKMPTEKQRNKEYEDRLSAIIDIDPASIDLIHPNRPFIIAEKVSDLYDNEWTSAIENLEEAGTDEKDGIKILLDIVANIFQTCEEFGDKQTQFINSLEIPVAVPDIDDIRNRAKPFVNSNKLQKLPDYITKPLKDYRKMNCEVVSPLLYEAIKTRMREHLSPEILDACDEFIKNTVTCVWMMRVKDPPVHIEWDFKHGDKFDHDRLRSYTKGGDRLDYVVWPILYLHKGGPMLSKGVAQGMKSNP